MDFIIVLVCTAVFVYVFKDAIYKAPVAFYALALVLSILYFATSYYAFPLWLKMALFTIMQKGTLATAVFVIVMYIGVFRDIDFIRRRLMPTRAALSIIGCILILGHVFKYLTAFLPRFSMLNGTIQVGLVVSIVCFAIMVVLGVTSVQRIKQLMSASAWVRLQKWAYLFFALVYAHAVILLAPSAVPGSTAFTSIVVYTVVFGLYAVLRIGKAVMDRRGAVAGEAKSAAVEATAMEEEAAEPDAAPAPAD